jgi:hypothetical protein
MWLALAFGLIGLIIFVQYPAGGVPFLLLAAFMAWRARARITLTFSGLAQRAQPPAMPSLSVNPPVALTPFGAVRFVLAVLALSACALSLCVLLSVFSAFVGHFTFTWAYSGVGLLIGAALGWAGWSIWRFRQVFAATDMGRQLIDGALRLVAASLGALLGVWSLSWLPQTLSDDWSIDNKVVACVAFPAFVFLAAAGLGFAHREQLTKSTPDRPALRVALWTSALGAAISAALICAAVCVHLTGLYHRLSVAGLVWAVCCGLVAFAALVNARSVEASARRFGFGYVGAFIAALGALIPALWLESFVSGKSLLESWNILIVFMPFILLGSMAVSVLVILLGCRLYRKAF